MIATSIFFFSLLRQRTAPAAKMGALIDGLGKNQSSLLGDLSLVNHLGFELLVATYLLAVRDEERGVHQIKAQVLLFLQQG